MEALCNMQACYFAKSKGRGSATRPVGMDHSLILSPLTSRRLRLNHIMSTFVRLVPCYRTFKEVTFVYQFVVAFFSDFSY